MRRLNLITTANGYDFDLQAAVRNPENEPSPDRMPLTNIFEFPELTVSEHSRGASIPPVYKKELLVVLEHWYASASRGSTTPDIYKFLNYSRRVLFSDGITLGRFCDHIEESEISRVYRPPIANNVIGIGQVVRITYTEDFNNA
jgi:hypothetical protein